MPDFPFFMPDFSFLISHWARQFMWASYKIWPGLSLTKSFTQNFLHRYYIGQCFHNRILKVIPAICILSSSHAVLMKFIMGKLRQASFQSAFKLCDVLGWPHESQFDRYRTIIHNIEKWNPQRKYILSTSDYLAEYFLKTDFIHLFEIFYRVLQSEYFIFSKTWSLLRHWHLPSE